MRYESIRKEIFYRCRFKIDGHWRRAQISFETGKILIREQEVRMCNTCYKQLKLIEKLKNKVVLLWKQKEQIDKEKIELKHLDIDTGLNMGIDYSREKIQISSDGSSQAERKTIKYIDNLNKQYKYTIRKIIKTNARIRELELQNQDMNFNLSMLTEESKRFLEWKYGEGKSVEWIATEMFGGARATAYRKREELVGDIAQWCNFVG